ncbi:TonB-dependent receptor [Flavobacterium ardleyense]|uniref:TonB-dependent receptor n=1 Tax=Flavobacterium ardleyense TaxID=2038737 RepID=A0ABW5ZAI1_9FLAO
MKNIFFVLLCITQILNAQELKKEGDSIEIKNLEEVVVTANRAATLKKNIPLAISKISEKTISETNATSLSDIVNKAPGVTMVNLGNEQHSMSIRQPMTTNAYYLYLEDGLSIRPMGIFNHNALLEINQFNLESIEIIKGAASSLYGPEAVGGAINLISKAPTENTEFKIGSHLNDWGYKRLQAAASGSYRKFGYHVSGLFSNQKDSWRNFSDYKKDNINARFDYTFKRSTKLISTTFYGNYYSDMSGSVNDDDFYSRNYRSLTDFTYRKSEALRTKLILDHKWNSNSNTTFTTYFRANKLGQNPSYGIRWRQGEAVATGQINSNDFKSYGALAQHIQQFNFLNSKIVTGLMYDYSPIDYWAYQIDLKANLNPGGQTVANYVLIAERPDLPIANYNNDLYNIAEYMQFEIDFSRKFHFTSGVRNDEMKMNYRNNIDFSSGSKNFNKLTFKSGANFNPSKEYNFYVNYSEGFSPPGISSIFKLKTGTGGTTGYPAEFYYNLESATFHNYEFGGRVFLLENKLNFEYAFYYMEGKNEMLNVRLADNSYDYLSAGKTRHKGIEFSILYNPSSQFSLRIGGTTAQHTFINFVLSEKPSDIIKNLNGYEMPNAPKWSGNSEISYYPAWCPELRTALEWQFVSNYFQDQVNTIKYGGYNVFNGRIGYHWKGFEASLNIMNMTDKLYAHNVSRGNTTTSQSTYTVAAPRTFVFGLQYAIKFKK